MVVLEDRRFVCTTEVTTLNRPVYVVALPTRIAIRNTVSCGRPSDAPKRGLVFGGQYLVRRLSVRTHQPNLTRSEGAPQPFVGNAGTVG